MLKSRKKIAVAIIAILLLCISVIVYINGSIFDDAEKNKANKKGSSFVAQNPIIYADVPDPDVIRVDDFYYMVSTSMHMMPGSPIMKSSDLINWEIIGYPYDRLEENDAHNLVDGKNIYGQGSWASSLCYYNETFYVLTAALDSGKTYLFSSRDPSGEWSRVEFNEYLHDPTLLFDEDSKAYIIYGVENFSIKELTADYKAINYSGAQGEILQSGQPGMEGAHAYKINGKYFITAIYWEKGDIRKQYIYRADELLGPYEGKLALSDTMDYKHNGVAQGGLVEDKFGNWHAMLFQDHDAVGRIPVLVPIKWEKDWPIYGIDGKVPQQLTMWSEGDIKTNLTKSDGFLQLEPVILSPIDELPKKEEAAVETKHNIIVNSSFDHNIADWSGKDQAKVKIIEEQNNKIAYVHERKATYAGIEQNVTNKLVPQKRYNATFKVKYSEGPDQKEFILTARKIKDGNVQYENLVRGLAVKNEWTELSGSFAINDADTDNIYLFIETPWLENPTPELDFIDFYVDDIVVAAQPSSAASEAESALNDSELGLHWQWNHNPDNSKWSLTERQGYLRLKTSGIADSLQQARNTLTQRGIGPYSSGWIAFDTSSMRDGDIAGLAAFQAQYGFVGVKQEKQKQYIVMVENDEVLQQIELEEPFIYAKVDFDFIKDEASFFYSYNGEQWHKIGKDLSMHYTLPHFMGYRFALFNYATEQTGGYVDIDYFRFEPFLTELETELELHARIKEAEIVLQKDMGTIYEVNISLDKAEHANTIKLDLSLPDYLQLNSVSLASPQHATHANITSKLSDNITTILIEQDIDSDAVDIAKYNPYYVKLVLQQTKELNELSEKEIRLNAVTMTNTEGDEHTLNVTGASTTTQYSPPNEAIGKLIGYGNPLVSNKFGADPYALVHEGRVYLYMTNDVFEYDEQGEIKENSYSSINTLTVISSDDLVNWTDHGAIKVAGPNGAAKWATQSWAPAIVSKEIDGQHKFFLYFANNASHIGVLTSDSPLGPWVDPIGRPLISRTDPGVEAVTWLFDPAVLVDDDGQGYIYFGGGIPEGEHVMPNTARVAKLGDDMISLASIAEAIPAPYMFENSGINKVNGLYYYTYCSNFIEGVRGENDPKPGQITYMVSDSPMGPWEYKGTILKNPVHFFDVGGNNHHAIFEFENQHYIAYHAQTLSKAMGHSKGYRSTHLNKVFFEKDGTIREIEADYAGVEATKNLNPYLRVEAETFAWNAGISTKETDMLTNRLLTDIHNGDWIAVRNADLTGATTLVAAVIAGAEPASIDIRVGSPEGEKIGEIAINSAAASTELTELSTSLSAIEGVHDLFFVFRGKNENELFSFDYWFVK